MVTAKLRMIFGRYTFARPLCAAHDTETPAVKAEGESAWLGSERGRRNGDRFDADHIEKFSCAEDLGDAMCTKRQHPAPITRDQIVGVARLRHGKQEIIGRIRRSLDCRQSCQDLGEFA